MCLFRYLPTFARYFLLPLLCPPAGANIRIRISVAINIHELDLPPVTVYEEETSDKENLIAMLVIGCWAGLPVMCSAVAESQTNGSRRPTN